MEYVLLACIIVWVLSVLIGDPLWSKYTAWIKKNFVDKQDGF